MRCLFAVTLLTVTPAATAEAPPRELLDRLAEWAARTDVETEMASVVIKKRTEELDGDGAVLHTETLELKLTHAGDGEPARVDVLAATRDGADNRIEALERQEKQEAAAAERRRSGEKPRGAYAGGIPFRFDQRDRYRFELLPPYPDDPDTLRIGFSPKRRPDPELFVGEAKVDAQRGAVLWLKGQPSKLPTLADRFQLQMFFAAPSSAGPLLSEMRMYGEGGVLRWKKRFRATLRFEDARLREAP